MRTLTFKIDLQNKDLFLAFTNALRLTVYYNGTFQEQDGYDDTGLRPIKFRTYALFQTKAGETREYKLKHFVSRLPKY